jgi:hypothetical protein
MPQTHATEFGPLILVGETPSIARLHRPLAREDPLMTADDLKKLANTILHADSEAEMFWLIAPLTAE